MSSSNISFKQKIETANATAAERMMDSDPMLVDLGPARKMISGLSNQMLLHAGPPIEWKRMSGPMRGAVIGAILYEGWASTPEEAEKLAAGGKIEFEPNHHHNAVGPMTGIISPNMPVFVIEDRTFGAKTFTNLNEGIGKVLRFGAYGHDVLERLKWMSEVLVPVLQVTIKEIRRQKNGVAIRPILAQALTMGDECHNRNNAATSLFLRELGHYLFETSLDKNLLLAAYDFLNQNNFTMLNLAMASAKAMALAAHKIEYSTIITVLTRNGTDAGIWVSGLGDEWFTAPSPVPKGVWFPGYSEADANPDLGDSAITETVGLGGFAMAAAPAITAWVGGSASFAVERTRKMYEITFTKHKHFLIPFLDFEGAPTGIDLRKIVRTGITPTINTGIAHKQAGVGHIGAGMVEFPMEPFKKALTAYAEKYGLT